MSKRNEIIAAAEVQPAVSIEQAKAELRPILRRIEEGEAALQMGQQAVHDWRRQAGAICAAVRKTIPQSGRNAKAWGEFLTEMGLTASTAGNYMKLAEFADRYPTEAATISVGEIYKRLGIGLPAPTAILASTCEKGPEAPKPAPAASKQKVPAAAPAVPAETPKPAEKTKAPPLTRTRDRDAGGDSEESQDAPDYEGPVTNIDPPAAVPEPRPFAPALFGGGPDDGKPAPDPRPWEGDDMREQKPIEVFYKNPSTVPPGFMSQIGGTEDERAEAALKKIEGAIEAFAASFPNHVGRLGQFLMGQMRVTNIEAKKRGQL